MPKLKWKQPPTVLQPARILDIWPGEFDLPQDRPLTEEEAADLLSAKIDGQYSD